MTPFDKCPVCGGEIVERQVQKLLRGGRHTPSITVTAKVCLHCGERLYSSEAVKRFEEIHAKLDRQETLEFQPIGQSFKVKCSRYRMGGNGKADSPVYLQRLRRTRTG